MTSGIEPVTPAVTPYSAEFNTPVGEAIGKYNVRGEVQSLMRNPEQATLAKGGQPILQAEQTTVQIAPKEMPQLPQSSLPPGATSGTGRALPPNDLTMFSRNPAELAQQTMPQQTTNADRITPRYWVANETDRLFKEPQPETAIYPADIHEIYGIQAVEDETDARRSSGNKYVPFEEKDEVEKEKTEELEQTNLIVDEAASWKGHETKTHYSPETLSQASEDLISSFLPFAGLYRFSNS